MKNGDYIRDRKTGALFHVNAQTETRFNENKRLQTQVESMREEINTLKTLVNQLLAARN
jgi:hypothetical protein